MDLGRNSSFFIQNDKRTMYLERTELITVSSELTQQFCSKLLFFCDLRTSELLCDGLVIHFTDCQCVYIDLQYVTFRIVLQFSRTDHYISTITQWREVEDEGDQKALQNEQLQSLYSSCVVAMEKEREICETCSTQKG